MKKIISLFVVLVISISIIGCGESKPKNTVDGEVKQIDYPKKPIKLICPLAVGGGVDVFVRAVASVMDKYLDKPVVVVNMPGAASSLAIEHLLREDADGYNITILATPILGFQPHLKKVNYSWDDFEPIIGAQAPRLYLLSNPKRSGIESLEDIVELAKNKKVTMANGGVGSVDNIYPHMLFKELGIDVEDVVFTTTIESQNALLGGHVDLAAGLTGNFEEQAKYGDLKILGTYSSDSEQMEIVGEIPSFDSMGYDVAGGTVFFMVAKKDTPKEIIDILNKAFNEAYNDPYVLDYLEKFNLRLFPVGPEGVDEIVLEAIEVGNQIFKK